MKSKFLEICEKLRKNINEQNNIDDSSPMNEEPATTAPDQPAESPSNDPVKISDNTESAIPVASNEDIVKLIQSIKDFYANNKKFEQRDIDAIKNFPLSVDDKNVKEVIDKLILKFNPESVDTNPKNVEDSRFN
jgi:hypothetical protein